jgi:hypothetical protein
VAHTREAFSNWVGFGLGSREIGFSMVVKPLISKRKNSVRKKPWLLNDAFGATLPYSSHAAHLPPEGNK